jgi:hypothetical protein
MSIDNIECHIIGFNPIDKNNFINTFKNNINIIDLDILNNQIINNKTFVKYNNLFENFKNNKNDKYKDVEKNMYNFWINYYVENINNKINKNKKNVLIGNNFYFNNIKKIININTKNKFILSYNDNDIRILIKYNIENYKDDIINSIFPLSFLDFDFLKKKKEILFTIYNKNNYITKSFNQIINIINNIDIISNELWIALYEPYNINSFINCNKIINAYDNPQIAILKFLNIDFKFENNNLIIKENDYDKLKKSIYLYFVDNSTFIKSDIEFEYLSNKSVKIINKIKINNILDYLNQ